MKGPATECLSDPTLFDAAAAGDLRQVKLLLQAGISPDIVDEEGMSALMSAAFAGHARTVDILLAFGADANLQDISGCTALMNAVIADGEMDLDSAHAVFIGIIESLLEAGAELGLEDDDGMTARDHAAAYELHETLALFGAVEPTGRPSF